MLGTVVNWLCILTTVILWIYVVYQTVLEIAGYLYIRRIRRFQQEMLFEMPELPEVTLLVPAHNEEKVIENTVLSLLALEYPANKLKVFVVNDASTDGTARILDRLAAQHSRVFVLHRTPEEGGKGKSAVLNHALRQITSDYVAIYDADNCPEPSAIKLLMVHFVNHPELGAVVGKFRTGNRRRNILTRFINIEGLCYQGIIQAGRCQLFGVAMLTGTNYIIRRDVVEGIGGWDEEALTEDADLSARVYQAGFRIAYVPDSISWEQEPETARVWVTQRTRWARGNLYVMGKLFRSLPTCPRKAILLEMLFMLTVPFYVLYTFTVAQCGLLLSFWQHHALPMPPIVNEGLFFSACLYVVQIVVALSYDDEDTLENLLVCLLAYYTYCQAWLIPLSMALFKEYVQKKQRTWDKTERFDTVLETADTPMLTTSLVPVSDRIDAPIGK